MKEKVSILMPSYNYEKYIGEAIESVIKQTYSNWELIIIDDGSKDSSVEIIKSFKDKRIKLYIQDNSGVTITLNKALNYSSGKYICFLDADDKYHPEKIEKQIQMINSGYDIVTTKVNAINKESRNSSDKFFDLWWNSYDPNIIFGEDREYKFFNGNYLCKSALMLKKDLFLRFGNFNNSLITAYDLELWIKMIPFVRIGRCNQILTYYRWHGLNETIVNPTRMRTELLLIYDDYLDNLHLSLGNSPEKVNKFLISFQHFLNKNELLNAYNALQILKKSTEVNNSIDLLKNNKALDLIIPIIENKRINNTFITKGQRNLSKLFKKNREPIYKRIRRKIIPYDIRLFIKSISKSSKKT